MYSWAALQRNNQYRHSGYEHTYFNGDLKNSNFNDPNFFQRQKSNYALAITDRTFIKTERITSEIDENDLLLSFDFSNDNTFILNPAQNIMSFHAVFVQSRILESYGNQIEIPNVITQYITEPISGYDMPALSQPNEIDFIDITVPISTINLLDDNDYKDLSVLSWIQDNQNKIHYHSFLPLADLNFPRQNEPENIPKPNIVLYPNPLTTGNTISISYINSKQQNNVKVSVYNIKGQKLLTQKLENQDFTLESDLINTSGIYFIRVDWTEEGKNKSQINKYMILK